MLETDQTLSQDLEVSKNEFSSSRVVLDLYFTVLITLFARTRVDKVNAELVTLTYGTVVAQLCNDYDHDYTEVNKQLDKMGYNIGMRLIEDFLAKSGTGRCGSFRETAEAISRVLNSRFAYPEGLSLLGCRSRLGWVQDVLEHHAYCHQLD